jgi:NADH-quinone oxidoreductase subunit N
MPNSNYISSVFVYDYGDLICLAPELFILFNLLAAVVYFAAYAGRNMHGSFFMAMYYYLGLYVLVAFFLSLQTTKLWYGQPLPILGAYLIHDELAIYAKATIYFLTFICGIISRPYFKVYPFKAFEYVVIAGLSIIGSTLLVSSFDLTGFFLAMELTSFCLYTLAASRFNSVYAVEAAIKYYVQGSFASGIFVFGLAMFFSMTGTTNYYAGQAIIMYSYMHFYHYIFDFMYLFSSMLLMLTLPLFKIAAAPFHYWIADVYEGSPLPVTAFFSIVIKFVMTISLVRIVGTLFKFWMCFFRDVLIFYALLSILIGTFAACAEQRIKRILAYSSITHSGYLIIGLIPAYFESFGAVIEYAFIYAITNLLIFAFLMACVIEAKTPQDRQIIFVSDLGLISNKSFFYGVCFSVAMLSLSGLPPFAGFFVKFNILYNFWSFGYCKITAFIIMYSVISTYYYLRFIKCLFFSNNVKQIHLILMDKTNKLIMFLITSFISAYPIIEFIINAFCLQLGASATAYFLPRLNY